MNLSQTLRIFKIVYFFENVQLATLVLKSEVFPNFKSINLLDLPRNQLKTIR